MSEALPPTPPVELAEPPQEFPHDFVLDVLSVEIAARTDLPILRAAVDHVDRLYDGVGAARESDPPVLGADAHALRVAGIDPEDVLQLIHRINSATGVKGQLKKVGLWPRFHDAIGQLHAAVGRHRELVKDELVRGQELHRQRVLDLQRRRPGVDAYIADRDFIYAPTSGYFGDAAAARFADRSSTVPHMGWILDPMDGVVPWARVPYTPGAGITWITTPGADYRDGCAAARALVLSQMACAFPRRLNVTWIDPAGRGSSAGALLEMLEIDKDLLDTQVWSEADEIDRALRRITGRMAYLEQRCLKSRFADLEEYNVQAGSLAEPNHVIVVTGYPRNFTEDSLARFTQIVSGGGKLGITVHIVTDGAAGPAQLHLGQKLGYPELLSVTIPGFHGHLPPFGHSVFGHGGRPHVALHLVAQDDVVWVPAIFPGIDDAAARQIVEGYGRAAVQAANVVIDADSLTSDRTAGASTAEEVVIPIGALGRGDRFDIRIGRGLAQNVLVGGLPGSGKSTLFHTIISTVVRSYDPSELELYLLDFKQGVEFQPYADAELPHARVVAVQSERAFGVSVLSGLRDELEARSARFKRAGAASLAEYRARTGEVLPRVLVVVDEFQVLFAAEDRIATECAGLLEHLVRQGRSYGVHMILGTQSMRGATQRMLGPTLDLIALRIVLKTSETDSELFLAADNRSASRLTRPGEAIYNPDNGSAEGNLAFQVALTTDASRDAVLVHARTSARASGWTRSPLVFDGTRAISVADDERLTALVQGRVDPDPRTVHLHLGLPVAIGGAGAGVLWRRGGAHALLIGRDWPQVMGSLSVGLTTACLSGAKPQIAIVDCSGVDDDHGAQLSELASLLPGVRCVRRTRLVAELADAAAEVRRRVANDDYAAPRSVVVINALQRARELDDADAFDPSPVSVDLRTILRDGSDVGVHLVVTVDTVETVYRRAGRDALGHFGIRLLGRCSPQASDTIIGTAAAAELSSGYALLHEPDEHRLEQVRPFPIPKPDWVRAAVRNLHRP